MEEAKELLDSRAELLDMRSKCEIWDQFLQPDLWRILLDSHPSGVDTGLEERPSRSASPDTSKEYL